LEDLSRRDPGDPTRFDKSLNQCQVQRSDIERFWPLSDGKVSQDAVNAWLLARAKQQNAKLKQTDCEVFGDAKRELGATSRQVLAAFAALDHAYKYARG